MPAKASPQPNPETLLPWSAPIEAYVSLDDLADRIPLWIAEAEQQRLDARLARDSAGERFWEGRHSAFRCVAQYVRPDLYD